MQAYLVFKGGGVKGAALAGCLQATIQARVTPVGFGGASAGALVATLAAAGYTGEELLRLMKSGQPLNPRTLLDDQGVVLRKVRTEIERGRKLWRDGGLMKWPRIFGLVRENRRIIQTVLRDGGIYHGDKLGAALLEHLREKLPSAVKDGDIDFRDLPPNPLLKIVASDLSKKRAAVFSAKDTECGTSVIKAARASAGYPFVFRPVTVSDRLLSDGGLASNLPAFLFAEESRRTRHPILAFDLVAGGGRTGPAAVDLLPSILETVLEASDDLLAQAVSAYRVPVKTPDGIDTLDFDLRDDQIEALFHVGYAEAQRFLSKFKRLTAARSAGETIVRELQAVYAPPNLIFPVLEAVVLRVGALTRARGLRVSVMLPTGRPDDSRIVVYPWGFRDDSDADLELPHLAGCSGQCIQNVGPLVADLEKAKLDFAHWGMSQLQQAKVSKDRKSMISVPIFTRPSWTWAEAPSRSEILGVISVDSATRLDDTGWLAPNSTQASPVINERLVQSLIEWADVLTCLLQAERAA